MKAKTILIIFIVGLLQYFSFSQSELQSIDSTLKEIDSTSKRIDDILNKINLSINTTEKNLSDIKKSLVKDDGKFTGQSIFEDRKGNSAIFLKEGGTIRLNTADASFKLSFRHKLSDQIPFFGFDIEGKTNDGIAALFSNGVISPGIKLSGIFGFQEIIPFRYMDGWLVFQAGYERSAFKLYHPKNSFADQIEKTTFETINSSVALNVKFGGIALFAISGGYTKSNNYEDLDEIELTDKKTYYDSTTSTTRFYEKKIKVRGGDYKISKLVPINFDLFWIIPGVSRIGLYHFWRLKIEMGDSSDDKTINGFGSGIYWLSKDNPLSAIAGMVFEFKDISKISDNLGKNFTVNFLVGYNFSLRKKDKKE